MKSKQLVLTILIVCCGLFVMPGCRRHAMAKPQMQLNPEWFRQFDHLLPPGYDQPALAGTEPAESIERIEQAGVPKIAFESLVHNFGNVGPTSNNFCEFRFMNTGTGILKIEDVEKVCGCTPFELAKKEYAPGEIGILKVQYNAEEQFGPVTKNLLVRTNDRTQPEIELAIVASIISKIDYEPKALGLMLKGENAGCPNITLSSVDNQPFSITYFRSSSNCITADFDPSAVATSFVLAPKVDMIKLARTMEGNIEIGLTHPECKAITMRIDTLPRFRVSPRQVTLRGIAAGISITKKVVIANNYNEDFELDSTWSKSGAMTMLNSTRIPNGYELELQVTPPASDRRGILSDTLFVRTKDGEQLEIPCLAYYAGTNAPPVAAGTAEDDGKCKICGPRVIDPTTGKVSVHKAQE